MVDRYLRLMGDEMIPDSAEPRLESFYPPFVAGIDLPHQGVVDSYNLVQCCMILEHLSTSKIVCQHFISRVLLGHVNILLCWPELYQLLLTSKFVHRRVILTGQNFVVTCWHLVLLTRALMINNMLVDGLMTQGARASAGPLFTKKTPSYRYRDSRYKPKMVWQPSQLYNGDSYTHKTASL